MFGVAMAYMGGVEGFGGGCLLLLLTRFRGQIGTSVLRLGRSGTHHEMMNLSVVVKLDSKEDAMKMRNDKQNIF